MKDDLQFRDKLRLLTLFRVAAGILLLTVVLVVDDPGSLAGLWSGVRELLYSAVAVLLSYSVVVLVVLERLPDDVSDGVCTWIAYSQFVVDAVFSSVMVIISGGHNSGFTFLYSLSVINAALLLYRSGALLSAGLGLICFAVVGLGQAGRFGDWFRQWIADSSWLEPGLVESANVGAVATSLSVNGVALFAVAFLSSFLAEQVRKTDVSALEQRRTLEELTNLHEHLVSSLEAGVVTINNQGRVAFANGAALALLGLSWEKLKARDVSEVLPGLSESLLGEAGDNGIRHVEIKHTRPDGAVLALRWSVSKLRDPDGASLGHTLIAFDVTRVREMEEVLERSERLAALGRLAASIAHEIRNPLASLSGSIQLLSSMTNVEGAERQLMDIVVREADHLNRWIGDFLEYSRPLPMTVINVDLRSVVGDVIGILTNDERAAGVCLQIDGPSHLVVGTDPVRVRQMVWNLVLNSVQATSSDASARALGPRVVVSVGDAGSDFVIRVEDNGPGIPSDIKARVFEPFFTTKADGTGLGLATVMRNVMDLNGSVVIDSGLDGTGASVTVRIPRQHVQAGDSGEYPARPRSRAVGQTEGVM